jgi:hypothetical protein
VTRSGGHLRTCKCKFFGRGRNPRQCLLAKSCVLALYLTHIGSTLRGRDGLDRSPCVLLPGNQAPTKHTLRFRERERYTVDNAPAPDRNGWTSTVDAARYLAVGELWQRRRRRCNQNRSPPSTLLTVERFNVLSTVYGVPSLRSVFSYQLSHTASYLAASSHLLRLLHNYLIHENLT